MPRTRIGSWATTMMLIPGMNRIIAIGTLCLLLPWSATAKRYEPAVFTATVLAFTLPSSWAQLQTSASRAVSPKSRMRKPTSSSLSGCQFDDVRRRRDKVIRIGVILSNFDNEYNVSLKRARPAFELAREDVYQRDDLLKNYTIEFDFWDSNCSEVNGPLAGIEMYSRREADAFIGPSCNYAVAPLARFASAWDIPIITAGGLVQQLGDKSWMYRLLTRMISDYDKVGEFFLTILKKFDWHNVGMLMHGWKDDKKGTTVQEFTLEATFRAIRKEWNPNITSEYVHSFDINNYTKLELEGYLRSLSDLCRGEVFYCGLMGGRNSRQRFTPDNWF
ncbi:guanylate cyclase [Elysia marginata]|uniref:Guanylate cyclase n=1 Tax=Elysia marginata TaxID=1093978 RepID=A0AAV4GUY9_9GAST|nr:guanylate cyclase [Elysia marginata]